MKRKMKWIMLALGIAACLWIYPWSVHGQITPNPERITTIAWSPDGQQVAFGTDIHKVYLYDISTFSILAEISTAEQSTKDITWSPDLTKLAITSFGLTGTLEIFDVDNFTSIQSLQIVPSSEMTITWSPDGRKILGTSDFNARVWDVSTGQILANLEGHFPDVNLVHWSQDGTWLLTIDFSGVARKWDASTYALIHVFSTLDHISSAAISPSENEVAVVGGTIISVWSLESGQLVTDFEAHQGEVVRHLAWSNNRLASFGQDREENYTIKIWHTSTWKLLQAATISDYIYDFAWNKAGTKLAFSPIVSDTVFASPEISVLVSLPTPEELSAEVARCISDRRLRTLINDAINSQNWDDLVEEIKTRRDDAISEECADILIEMAETLAEQQ